MHSLPTVLPVSNDGGGGVTVCVTGCLGAAAGPLRLRAGYLIEVGQSTGLLHGHLAAADERPQAACWAYAPGMDPTVTGALIGAGGAVIVAVAGFLANVRNTSVTSAVSKSAVAVSQQAVEAARRTVELTEQGQVTDRYTKAIDQLSSKELEVRIGGIYALERIARDSPRDHPTVMEVLATFVRDHSREPWPPPPAADPPGTDPAQREIRPDVQAGITVIGRRDRQQDRQTINLSGSDLTGASFEKADLNGVELTGANLTRAWLRGVNLFEPLLSGANFTGAWLREAKLTFAHLYGANLTGANLTGADLSHADLGRADLTRANLTHANLTEANLTLAKLINADLDGIDQANFDGVDDGTLPGADLTRANLDAADFTGANLTRADLTHAVLDTTDFTGANLTGARWASHATIPEGWQRDNDSGRLSRADANSGNPPTDPASTV